MELIGEEPISQRRLRLLNCALVRSIWSFYSEQNPEIIAVAERYADGLVSDDEFSLTQSLTRGLSSPVTRDIWLNIRIHYCLDTAVLLPGFTNDFHSYEHARPYCEAIRDVICDPGLQYLTASELYCPLCGGSAPGYYYLDISTSDRPRCSKHSGGELKDRRIDQWLRWQNSTPHLVAKEIYQTGDFSKLPVLADALLDAGCTDQILLEHFRSPCRHYRGCWALDFVLSQE